MIVKMTSKRQVTFPKQVMQRLNLKEGDTLQISETNDGIVIRPLRFDINKLAPLRSKIDMNLPPPDIDEMRHAYVLDPSLQD